MDHPTGDTYSFSLNLEKKRIELILKKPFLSEVELVVGEVAVPDMVLIAFYKELRKLNNEYQATNAK